MNLATVGVIALAGALSFLGAVLLGQATAEPSETRVMVPYVARDGICPDVTGQPSGGPLEELK